jgi:hypothetical protein
MSDAKRLLHVLYRAYTPKDEDKNKKNKLQSITRHKEKGIPRQRGKQSKQTGGQATQELQPQLMVWLDEWVE